MISNTEITKITDLNQFLSIWKNHSLGINRVSEITAYRHYTVTDLVLFWNDPVNFYIETEEVLPPGGVSPRFTPYGKYVIKPYGAFYCTLFPKAFDLPIFRVKEDLINFIYSEFGNDEAVFSIDKPSDIGQSSILPLAVTDFDLYPTFSHYHNHVVNKATGEDHSYYNIILYINGRKLLLMFDPSKGIFLVLYYGGAELYSDTETLISRIAERTYQSLTLTDLAPQISEY